MSTTSHRSSIPNSGTSSKSRKSYTTSKKRIILIPKNHSQENPSTTTPQEIRPQLGHKVPTVSKHCLLKRKALITNNLMLNYHRQRNFKYTKELTLQDESYTVKNSNFQQLVRPFKYIKWSEIKRPFYYRFSVIMKLLSARTQGIMLPMSR